MNIEEIEGKLSAQREILISLLAAFLSGDSKALDERLREETVFMDGEEDPGVVPSEAFGLEAARAGEIRAILRAARARVAADRHANADA